MALLQFAAIADCVDRALESFGRGTRDMIYLRLQSESKFSREDVVYRPEEFKTLLEGMFVSGSKLFERTITKALAKEFQMVMDSNFDLVGAIQQAKGLLSTSQEESRILA